MKIKSYKFFIFLFIIIIVGTRFFNTHRQGKLHVSILPEVTFVNKSYQHLPQWQHTNFKQTLQAFLVSCEWFMKQSPDKMVGNNIINLHAKDFQPICQRAMQLRAESNTAIRYFFEQNFKPMQWKKDKQQPALFTGYFQPTFEGSLERTSTYQIPVYGLPKDLSSTKKHHYYTRTQINNGAIKNKAPVLVWLKSEADRLLLEIQGSGTVTLANHKSISLGYAGENGASYRSIPKIFIDKGIFTKDTASLDNIKKYLQSHPESGAKILNANPSFVFFKIQKGSFTPSPHNLPLTPGYSMAVDKSWIPLGLPVWIATHIPTAHNQTKALNRLMIAQDVGGAIRGKFRGDIFWGAGAQAAKMASNLKAHGLTWLLIPKKIKF